MHWGRFHWREGFQERRDVHLRLRRSVAAPVSYFDVKVVSCEVALTAFRGKLSVCPPAATCSMPRAPEAEARAGNAAQDVRAVGRGAETPPTPR